MSMQIFRSSRLALVMLIVLAAGCRDRREPAADAGVASAAATPAAAAPGTPAKAAEGPAAERSTAVDPLAVVPLDAAALAKAAVSSAPCSFDSVGGSFFQGSLSVERAAPLVLRGWLSDEARKPAGAFRLVLKGEGRAFAIPAQTGVARPDVAKYFKNEDLRTAGFNVSTSLSAVPPGSYALWLLFGPDDAPRYCDTAKRLDLT